MKIFHGDRDPIVAGINADQLADQALQALTKVVDPRPEQDNGTTTFARVPNGHAYTRTSYRDDTGRTIVEQWTIHQAGHAWSGGSLHGSYTDPQGPDASAEFVRFFRRHRKPVPPGDPGDAPLPRLSTPPGHPAHTRPAEARPRNARSRRE